MPVNNKPFESEFGFKSPGFFVNSLGQITATSITLSTSPGGGGGEETSSGIELGNFTFVNNSIVTTNQGLTEILYGLATNEIDSIGTSLSVSAPRVNFSGSVKLPSFTTTQRDALTTDNGLLIFNTTNNTIEFFNGSWKKPITDVGNFTFSANTISASVNGNITISPSTGNSLVTTNFTATNITADSVSMDSATITDAPTLATDVANKVYVDRTSVALAIALGS